MEQGKPMYVESLLTPQELKECAQKYSTYNLGGTKLAPLPTTEQKWRYKMGEGFTREEIINWNKNLKILMTIVSNNQKVPILTYDI